MVSVDKAMHSLGPMSGYALPNATIPNTFAIILVYAQELFPLGYILYSWIFVFLVMSSISGLKNLGIRFLWLTVYKIRPHSTKPQALVIIHFNISLICKLTMAWISRFWCLWILSLSPWPSAWSFSQRFRITRRTDHKTTPLMSPPTGYPQKSSRDVLEWMHQ